MKRLISSLAALVAVVIPATLGAWLLALEEAGGGVIYNVSERVAFDVGYRFFSIDQADATYIVSFMGMDAPGQTLAQQFTASELLFGLRIYEPFRRWR